MYVIIPIADCRYGSGKTRAGWNITLHIASQFHIHSFILPSPLDQIIILLLYFAYYLFTQKIIILWIFCRVFSVLFSLIPGSHVRFQQPLHPSGQPATQSEKWMDDREWTSDSALLE